jgi:two-component system, NtrC family, response regulator HydG
MPPHPKGDDDLATVPREPPARDVTSSPSFTLVVAEGADLGKSMTIDAGQTRVLVGKSPACQFRLSDEEVSRRHLALSLQQAELRLTDLGSTNGTFVNGVKVVEACLAGGERIRIGTTGLHVDRAPRDATVSISPARSFGRVVGSSVEMRRLYPFCERLATTRVPVLIEGETGTGKELLAESLHEMSPRSTGPFVVFDCTAVPPNLVEAELFGYERGAFTGAVTTHRGYFERAQNGTLFIDEIGDLDPTLQPKLLRVLERSEVRRIGGDRWISVDVRILAATRRNLDQEIAAGRFRDDLFFRLVVARIELPPLRARHGDVATLANHFWKELGGRGALPYALLNAWESYPWPGNIRELHNEIARRIALGDLAPENSRASTPASGDFIDGIVSGDLPLTRARQKVVDEFHRRYVEHVVKKHGGSLVRAAAASGIAYRYFQLLRARQLKRPG